MSTPTSATADDATSKDQSTPTPVATKNDTNEIKNKDNTGVDSELDAILDSALADFDKPEEPKQSHQPLASGSTNDKGGAVGADAGSGDTTANADELNYDFLADAMTKQFEECFSSLIQDPAVKQQFEDLSKSAEEAASSNNPAAFAETVEKALSGMNLNAENLQNESSSSGQDMWEELAQSLAGAGGGGMPGAPGAGPDVMGGLPSMEGLGDFGAMGGMFQTMVQQLLSKELLYQPLKEVSVKYHEYLDKNKESLDAKDLSNYTKQLDIVEKVVQHLDGDSDSHSQEEKNARFEVLLELLQKMHELGNPPKEVVGEGNMMMPNLPDLANMGFPGMPGSSEGGPDPSQCALM